MNPALRYCMRPGILALLSLLLGACAPSRQNLVSPEESPPDSLYAAEPIDMRIIYVIHGDADYSYHDSTGNRLFADREAVKQARDVGRRARNAEVFIFDQKPSRQAFFDMSVKAGNYFHYSSGITQHRKTFTRVEGDPYLNAERKLLRRDANSAEVYTVLVYFGHEIPATERKGYFASDPNQELSLSRFTQGITNLGDSLKGASAKPFDLVILSSCYGGTPAMIRALAPLTKQIVASPAYLHLSFLDTRALADTNVSSLPDLADTIAAQSFAQLKNNTQTEITVGVYNPDSLKTFLEGPISETSLQRTQRPGARPGKNNGVWKDCANDPAFDANEAAHGVKLYYQPPRFGSLKNQMTRSAWQCLF